MKILSQNKMQIINSDQTLRIGIDETEGKMAQISAVNASGQRFCLGIYLSKEAYQVLDEIFRCTDSTFVMPRSQRYSGGRVLSPGDIRQILGNFRCSKHAIERMKERDLISQNETSIDTINRIVSEHIQNSCLAFWNEDGTAAIAVDATHYFVVKFDYKIKGYHVLTYMDSSENGFNVFDKQRLAAVKHRTSDINKDEIQ